jgi:paraquat-inducible protein B
MAPKTDSFLAEDTKFWIVRPRISGANMTGLGTLISGAYIGLEIGQSKEHKRDFVALETPPIITGEVPGHLFVLKTTTWVHSTSARQSTSDSDGSRRRSLVVRTRQGRQA